MEEVGKVIEDRIINRPATWFGMVPGWIFDYGDQIGSEGIAIFSALCFHANKERRCFPSQETIAKESGCSVRTVAHRIQMLEDLNLIRVLVKGGSEKGGKRLATVYEIVQRLTLIDPRTPYRGTNRDPRTEVSRPPQGVQATPAPVADQHIQEQSINISEKNFSSTDSQEYTEEQRLRAVKALADVRSRLSERGVLAAPKI